MNSETPISRSSHMNTVILEKPKRQAKFKKSHHNSNDALNFLVATAVITASLFSASAQAQTPPATTTTETTPVASQTTDKQAAKPAASVERVEVIGTRIKRIAVEGPSAVTSFKKETLKESPNTTVSDTLRDSNLATFGVSRETAGSSAPATSNIGLRGLGAQRTLVLLNGQRLPKDPVTEAVDLNLIPPGAIERIDVLKDGASALYGSDALGGVINIITKKGYVGNEVNFKYSAPELPGGGSLDISLLNGSSSEKSDLLTIINFSKTNKIYGRDRDVSREALSPTGIFPVTQDGAGVNTVSSDCPPDLVRPTASGNRCFYRFNEFATTRPEVTQFNYLTDYTYRINNDLKFYNRNLIVFKDIEWNFAPSPGAFAVSAGSIPEAPGAELLFYRFGEAGNRDNIVTERNYSTLMGLKGNINDTWEFDFSTGFSRVDRRDIGVKGYLDQTVLQTLIGNGTYNPFAPTPGVLSAAFVQPFQNSTSDLFTVEMIVNGEFGEAGAGPIGAAFGVSAWNETLEQVADTKSSEGLVIGTGGSNLEGSRDVRSIFGELSFPITDDFQVDAAARLDHYSDFGTTVNPKLAAKYTVSKSLLLRSSIGTGFKAPTLSQLYNAPAEGFPTFIDRRRCNEQGGTGPACSADQYRVRFSGNEKLKEEKALTGGLGFVYEPTPDYSVSIDGWYTKIDNVVGLDYDALTEVEARDPSAPAANGITITRDNAGAIFLIDAPNLNLQSEEISGLDINMQATLAHNLLGYKVSVSNDLSYLFFYTLEGFPGAGARNRLGEWGLPRWRNTLALNVNNDKLSVRVGLRTIPELNYFDRTVDQSIPALNEVDLSAAYTLSKKTSITLGIRNLFNTDQPADPTAGSGGTPLVDDTLYDINGRRFTVGFTQKF